MVEMADAMGSEVHVAAVVVVLLGVTWCFCSFFCFCSMLLLFGCCGVGAVRCDGVVAAALWRCAEENCDAAIFSPRFLSLAGHAGKARRVSRVLCIWNR